MSYRLHLVAGTEKAHNLLQHLSADPRRLQKIWPETLGLVDAREAGIEDEDYGWFLDDLQHAKIQRLGEDQYVIHAERLTDTTPEVLERLTQLNNRLGHPFLKSACYLMPNGQIHPVDARRPVTDFAKDNRDIEGWHHTA